MGLKVAMLTVLRLDILEQYKKAKEHGIDIDVITNGQEPRGMCSRRFINQCGLNEVIIPSNQLREGFKNYDIITTYEFYGPVQRMIMENFDNYVPEIAWNIPTYGTMFGASQTDVLKLARTRVKAFIAKSESVYNCLVQEGIPKDRIYKVMTPVDTDRFIPRAKPDRLKDKLVFLFIGRIQEQKGIFEMLHAFYRAKIPNSKLIYIGPPHPTNTSDVDRLRKWIEITGADVEIHPYVEPDKIHDYFCWGDVFITLSNTDTKFVEQIGITIPQALSSGLPVIANDFGGQVDFVDEKCGYLIPHKDYTKASLAMVKLADIENRKEMSMEARKRAESLMNLDTYVSNVKNVFEGVL